MKNIKKLATALSRSLGIIAVSATVLSSCGGGSSSSTGNTNPTPPVTTPPPTTPGTPPPPGACSGTPPAGTPAAPAGTFRLWLDDPTLTRLASAASANSPAWIALKARCDAPVSVPGDYQGDQYYRFAANYALCYRVTRQLGAPVDAYADKALTILSNNLIPFTAYGNDSGYGIRNYGPALAVVYDWLRDYAGFTAAQKTDTRTRMTEWTEWYRTSGYARSEPIANYHAGYMLGAVLMGTASHGETALTTGASLYTHGVSLFTDGTTLLDAKMPGGHWPEGWSYGEGVLEAYAMAASALKIASNDSGCTTSKWLNNNALLKLNALSPDGKFFYDDGLWSSNAATNGKPGLKDMYALGFTAGWSTTLGQSVRRYVANVVAPRAVDEWKAMLFFDPSSLPADNAGIANSYHAEGTGLITMRANRTDTNASWGSFISGPYLSFIGEQDADQGHMEIYRTAPLLIDAGHGLYNPEILLATRHHNTYTLEGRTNANGEPGNGAVQRMWEVIDPVQCPGNDITVERFADDGVTVFSSGEFSNAYKHRLSGMACPESAGVARLTRNVLYVRPNFFFVYDQIAKLASQLQIAPHMHLHFPTQPTSAGAGTYSVVNGSGKLDVRIVFPIGAVAAVAENSASGSVMPGWHLDVSAPDETPTYHRFLHVMRAGLSGDVAPTLTAISGTHAYGAKAMHAVDGNLIAVFADDGTTAIPTTLSYTIAATAGDRHFIARLEPNTKYAVAIGGATVSVSKDLSGAFTSNAAGVLAFTPP